MRELIENLAKRERERDSFLIIGQFDIQRNFMILLIIYFFRDVII